ncbi:hypothetical protein [Nonomuraea sp. NPDC049784]|uniref:hypothetical protein n=1 Tax=Nonomuraea sp. NPDC049784 TaxID=3154361 RepID=UPI00340DAC13
MRDPFPDPVMIPIMAIPVYAFVHWYEEPHLSRTFGADHERYEARVPGWWPTVHPYRS